MNGNWSPILQMNSAYIFLTKPVYIYIYMNIWNMHEGGNWKIVFMLKGL